MSDESDSEDAPQLSKETLEQLLAFAKESGCKINSKEEDQDDALLAIHSFFQDPDKDDVFDVDYQSQDGQRSVTFRVKGVKRELGQTLDSTGLTIWRASEHLCEYSMNHPELYQGKTVCELGAGLGMVAILLGKLNICKLIVATDGDDDTIRLLEENVADTESEGTVQVAKLYWGQLKDFLERYPSKFDTVIAADVIYEDEQVVPLVETVHQILSLDGEFIIAFARRNVPFDKVIAAAEKLGLSGHLLDSGINNAEPVYSFHFNK